MGMRVIKVRCLKRKVKNTLLFNFIFALCHVTKIMYRQEYKFSLMLNNGIVIINGRCRIQDNYIYSCLETNNLFILHFKLCDFSYFCQI